MEIMSGRRITRPPFDSPELTMQALDRSSGPGTQPGLRIAARWRSRHLRRHRGPRRIAVALRGRTGTPSCLNRI
jgi:hypothetical protein